MNTIGSYVLVAVLSAGSAWSINGWRLEKQIAQIERDQAIAAESASETARLKERALNKKVEDARNEATKRETKLRADAGRARSESDGLRGDLAELRRQLPELTADACRVRADTLAELFGSCSEEYRSVAEKAQRHASDVQTLMDGWPK